MKSRLTFIASAFFYVLTTSVVMAVEVVFEPAELSLNSGGHGVVTVMLKSTAAEPINAFRVTIQAPAGLIIENVEPLGGPEAIWTQVPQVFSNRVILEGGLTTPATAALPLARLILNPIKDGRYLATLAIDEASQVLIADGRGTPATLARGDLNIKVQERGSLVITSPSHPDETAWSGARQWELRWPASNASRSEAGRPVQEGWQYSYALAEGGSVPPLDLIPDEPVGMIAYPDLPDGIYVFSLIARNPKGEWSLPVQRLARMDATPPEPFKVELADNFGTEPGAGYLVFKSYDIMSGVESYEVREGQGGTFGLANSPFLVANREVDFTVRAVDYAGNIREATFDSGSMASNVLPAVLAFITIMVVIFILKRKK